MLLLLGCAVALAAAQPPVPPVRSGALRVSFRSDTSYELQVEGQLPARGAPLSVYAGGAAHTVANKGLRCGTATATRGRDGHGSYTGVALNCTAAGSIPAVFSWQAYGAEDSPDGRAASSP